MILGGRNADFPKVIEIIGNAFGRIVGEKSVSQPQLAKEGKERTGGIEKGIPAVNGAVHVERDMADGFQLFLYH